MNMIESPTGVLEALPSMLGFPPENSLVVVAVQRGAIGCVMRMDLDAVAKDGACERIAELAARNDTDAVVAVIVSRDGALCPVCGEQYRDLIRGLTEALERRDVRMLGAHVADRIEGGGRWHCIDNCGAGGVLNDPASSAVAAAAVADGRRLYRHRDEIKALVTADADRAGTLAPLLSAAGAVECVVDAVRAAVDAARRMNAGAALTDAEMASIGATVAVVRVRDRRFTTADSDESGAAEALWTLLGRVLPQPWRAEALTLLAFSAYLRGDGPLVGIALETVRSEAPAHRLAGLMDTALQGGVRPDEIRELLAGIPPAVAC
jgi:hypothetical protein